MKKKIILAILCALGAAAFGFSACSSCDGGDGLSDYVGGMKNSADSAVTVDASVNLADGEVTASVADTKVTYTTNFEQKTENSTSSVSDVKGDTIISLNLNEGLVSSYEIKDGDLKCTVAKDKISEVLKSNVSASSDMTLSVDFEDGKLIKVSYSYANASSRTVDVTVSYGY